MRVVAFELGGVEQTHTHKQQRTRTNYGTDNLLTQLESSNLSTKKPTEDEQNKPQTSKQTNVFVALRGASAVCAALRT